MPGLFPQVAEANARVETAKLENERARLDLEDRKASRNWDGAAEILSPAEAPPRDAPPEQLSGPDMEANNAARAAVLAGGPPAAGGVNAPADAPAAKPAGPQRAEDRIGFSLFQNPELAQDPGVDQRMRAYFMKNKNEAGMKWWESVKAAQNENFFAASHAAMAGNLDEAKKQFNASGKYQVNDLQWADPQKTTLRATLADGRTMDIKPGEEMKRLLSPKEYLDYEAARAEKRYKTIGNSTMVRTNPDGSVTPVYEGDQFGHTGEGDVYSKRTGEKKPEQQGVNDPTPKPGTARAARIDDRVKMSIDKVILPKYGGRFEGGMFFPDEANKDVALRATELAGQYVRGGMDPEAAGAKAVATAEREKALKPKPGAKPYEGPTPWKKPTAGKPAAALGTTPTADYQPPGRGAPGGRQGAATR